MKKNHRITRLMFIFQTVICFVVAYLYSGESNAQEKTPIFPIPQELQVTAETFALDESVSIVIPEKATDADISLARLLVRELSNKYGLGLKIETVSGIPNDRKFVVMGSVQNPLKKNTALIIKLT